jgi:hypothetical protein
LKLTVLLAALLLPLSVSKAFATAAQSELAAAAEKSLMAIEGNDNASAGLQGRTKAAVIAAVRGAGCQPMEGTSVDCSHAIDYQAQRAAQTISQINAQWLSDLLKENQTLVDTFQGGATNLLGSIANLQSSRARDKFTPKAVKIVSYAHCGRAGTRVTCDTFDFDSIRRNLDGLKDLATEVAQAAAEQVVIQAAAKKIAAKVLDVKAAIAKQPSNARDPFNQKLAVVLQRAGCWAPDGSLDCSNSTPTAVETGLTNLDSLSQSLTQATASQNGAQTLAWRIIQDARDISAAVGRLPAKEFSAKDRRDLDFKIYAIFDKAGCKEVNGATDCSSTTDEKLQTAGDALAKLRQSLGLKADAAPVEMTLEEKFAGEAQDLKTGIAALVAPDVRQKLDEKLNHVLMGVACEVSGTDVNCLHAPAVKLANAESDLGGLRQALAQAQKDALKSQALGQTVLNEAKSLAGAIAQLDPNAQQRLNGELSPILTLANCRLTGAIVSCSPAPDVILRKADNELSALSKEVTKAQADAAATQALGKKVAGEAQSIAGAIAQLNQDAQRKLNGELSPILALANCRLTGASVSCLPAPEVVLQKADNELAALNTEVKQAADQALAKGPTPAPTVGNSASVGAVTGVVTFTCGGTTEVAREGSQIPVGCSINATRGNVTLTFATPNGPQSGTFNGGMFMVNQGSSGQPEISLVASKPAPLQP